MAWYSQTDATTDSHTILMEPVMYKAAMEGRIDEVMLEANKDKLDIIVSPYKNTVLHIAALFGKAECLKNILAKCPQIYDPLNSRGETPLHIAAREGHNEIVKLLIKHANTTNYDGASVPMLMQTNEDKDTVLHEAVRNCHTALVELFNKEAPELSQLSNNAEETPLYLAAEKGLGDIVKQILECHLVPNIAPGYGGPYGRNALHAAVLRDSQDCADKLLEWKQDLLKESDVCGWTPLHYAARFGYVPMVKKLLEKDKFVAYLAAENDDKKTALHVATMQGHLEVMRVLISECPGCWEMLNIRGQNILHIAVKSGREAVMKFILRHSWLSSLINQKDNEGNTPLHLLVTSKCYMPEFIMHPRVDKNAFNKENLTALDVLAYSVPSGLTTAVGGPIERALTRGGAIMGRRNLSGADKDDPDEAVVGKDGKELTRAEKISEKQCHRITECSEILYDKKAAQIKEADINGWTPFRCIRFDFHSFITYILKKDTHVAYLVTEKDDKKTTLHISATFGSLSVMTKILEECPESWEMVNGRGQNILHTAVGSKEEEIIQFISE